MTLWPDPISTVITSRLEKKGRQTIVEYRRGTGDEVTIVNEIIDTDR